MEKIKIRADKHMPMHYHLIKFIPDKDRKRSKNGISLAYSDFYKGNMQILVVKKKISNL